MSIKKKFFKKKNKKLQLKFLIAASLLLTLVCLGVYYLYSQKYENDLTNNQKQREEIVIKQLAYLFELEFKSGYIEETEIEKIVLGSGIHHLAVTDDKDSVVLKFKFDSTGNIEDSASAETEILYKPNEISYLQKSITTSNSQNLNIICEFLRTELYDRIAKSKVEIGFISLLIFTLSFIVIFFTSFIIITPIQRLSDNIAEISAGNLTKRIKESSKSEFSEIAASVNGLAESLFRANNQVEKLNKELKFHFRDKIGELNYEINQRRHAEYSLKQSEEQFRLLFELAPIGMVISSIHGKIMKVNRAFHSALGYSEEEILNKKLKDFTYQDDQLADVEIHNKLLDGSQQSAYYEKRMIRKDNEIIHVIVEAVLVRNKDGKPSHMIEQVIDITERKRVESELILAKEKAEESDRLKSAFLAQMSHEIRTPLNVILTAMNLIQDDLHEEDEDTKVMLESCSSAGKRLQRTIDLILNISAVQSGSYSHEFSEFDLDAELVTLFDEFKTIASEKNLKLSYTKKTENTIVTADRYSVSQIFQNLFDNAIKYTQNGSVDVVLEDWNKEKIQVVVKDTGIGISKDYISNLFSPFSQEDVGHKREFEGNGLGLALVKKYVEINNAEILVESEKDKGSKFTIIFNKTIKQSGEERSQKIAGSEKIVEYFK